MDFININLSDSLETDSVLLNFGAGIGDLPLWIIQDGLSDYIDVVFGSREAGVSEGSEFTAGFLKMLTAAKPDWHCVIQAPMLIAFSDPERGDGSIGLSHLYASCKSAPEDQQRLMREFLTALTEPAKKPAELHRHVLPVLRAAKPSDEVSHQVNDLLREYFVLDQENTMTFVNEQMLKDSGLSKKELRLLALENLNRMFPAVEGRKVEAGVWQAMADGNYDASLILDESYWDKRQHPVQNEFVFAIPARDQLYFCDSKNVKALKTLRHLARTGFNTAAYPISDQLFVRRQGELRRFER